MQRSLFPAVTFIAQAGLITRELAHMLDSLVRVSRRAEWHHLVSKATHRQVQLQMFTSPRESLHLHRVLPARELLLTYKARNIAQPKIVQASRACAATVPRHPSTRQSRQDALVPFASLSAISGTFNSLFKVLFIFPSWYLFAIGLKQIFSFG